MGSILKRVKRARRLFVLTVLISTPTGCHLEGRSNRAERLLTQLAPEIRLGERLSDARHAIPRLRVRHPGDSTDIETPESAAPPQPVAVVVAPAPRSHEHADPNAVVEGVEFVMSPEVAIRVRQQIASVFRGPGSLACATRTIASTDSIVEWNLDLRGGALLTFPRRRPDGETPTSRLFVYAGGWQPARALSGYRAAPCEATM